MRERLACLFVWCVCEFRINDNTYKRDINRHFDNTYKREPQSPCLLTVCFVVCTLHTWSIHVIQLHIHFVFVWIFFYLALSQVDCVVPIHSTTTMLYSSHNTKMKSTEKRQWIMRTKQNDDGNTCFTFFFFQPGKERSCCHRARNGEMMKWTTTKRKKQFNKMELKKYGWQLQAASRWVIQLLVLIFII